MKTESYYGNGELIFDKLKEREIQKLSTTVQSKIRLF